MKGDRDAAKAVWAGAEAINAAGRGRWDVRAKTVPNVEVKVAAEDRSQRGADAHSERPSDTSRAVRTASTRVAGVDRASRSPRSPRRTP